MQSSLVPTQKGVQATHLAVVSCHLLLYPINIYIPQGAATTSQASCGKQHPKSYKTNQTGNTSAFSSNRLPQKPQ